MPEDASIFSDFVDPRLVRHPLGFWEVADKPNQSELEAYYAASYYQSERGNYRKAYEDSELRYIRAKIKQRAAALRSIGVSRPGRMLDVGCGEGFALSFFAAEGWQVEGIDHSSAGLKAMNPDMAESLEVGDVFSLLDRRLDSGESYDVVWLSNVLEHVLDPVGLMTQLRQIVDDEGALVVTVPNDFSRLQGTLLAEGAVDEEFWVALPDHISYFDYRSLNAIAEATHWDCSTILADFPIDWFLLHPGSNYVRDRALGPAAHNARIVLENLLALETDELVNNFYSAMAKVGLGRQITAILQPRGER